MEWIKRMNKCIHPEVYLFLSFNVFTCLQSIYSDGEWKPFKHNRIFLNLVFKCEVTEFKKKNVSQQYISVDDKLIMRFMTQGAVRVLIGQQRV